MEIGVACRMQLTRCHSIVPFCVEVNLQKAALSKFVLWVIGDDVCCGDSGPYFNFDYQIVRVPPVEIIQNLARSCFFDFAWERISPSVRGSLPVWEDLSQGERISPSTNPAWTFAYDRPTGRTADVLLCRTTFWRIFKTDGTWFYIYITNTLYNEIDRNFEA